MKADVLRTGEIVQGRTSMSARDAVHIAVMERYGIRLIFSSDATSTDGRGFRGFIRLELHGHGCAKFRSSAVLVEDGRPVALIEC